MSDAALNFALRAVPRAAAREDATASADSASRRTRYKWVAGRYVDRAQLPPLKRFLYDLWHRLLGMPPRSIPTLLGTFDTRVEAVGHCRDINDYVIRLPHGRPYGTEVRSIEGYCRPLDPKHAKLNESDAARFACEGENEELRETVAYLTDTLAEQVRDISQRMSLLEQEVKDQKRGAASGRNGLGISAAAAPQ